MNRGQLQRIFRTILAGSLPVPGALVLVACSSSSASSGPPAPLDATTVDSGGDDASETDAATPDDASIDAMTPDATYIVTTCGDRVLYDPGPFGSGCSAQCFPAEAGAFDAGDAGALHHADCAPFCGGSSAFSCEPYEDGGVSFIQCHPDCTGRRPDGLAPSPPPSGTPLGAYFAEMARLEAASVHAFRHLRRELVAHRAPRRLVRAAERAARDEVRHARTTLALARRYGGVVRRADVTPGAVRSLAAIAAENAVEGCVREAFGALVASWQALTARDPVVRAAMSRIARDETRHAELAFDVHAWLHPRLDATSRARIASARRQAIDEIARRRNAQGPADLTAALGLPNPAQASVLARSLGALVS